MLTIEAARRELVSSVTQGGLTEDEALLWMILLHTHEIHVRAEAMTNSPDKEAALVSTVLPAETQRGAASLVASLWPDRADRARCDYMHWYRLYNLRTPYEVLEDVPKDQLTCVLRLRDALAQDPRVVAVVEEADWRPPEE